MNELREKGITPTFQAELRPEQQGAVRRIISSDQGILSAPTAFGKTIVGAHPIAKRAVNTLILVHRRQLMDQWRERLAAFLSVPIGNIGQLGGGKTNRTGWIDVAVIQSLHRKGVVEDFVAEYGHVIVDERHHLSAVTFERVLRQVRARFVLGLTATPNRKDGHHPIGELTKGVNCALAQAGERHRLNPREVGAVLTTFGFLDRRRTNRGWMMRIGRSVEKRIHFLMTVYGIRCSTDVLPSLELANNCEFCRDAQEAGNPVLNPLTATPRDGSQGAPP